MVAPPPKKENTQSKGKKGVKKGKKGGDTEV